MLVHVLLKLVSLYPEQMDSPGGFQLKTTAERHPSPLIPTTNPNGIISPIKMKRLASFQIPLASHLILLFKN